MIVATLPRLAPAAAGKPPAAPTKPAVDWWTVGSLRYDTTADLVAKVHPPADGAVATYHFYDNPGDNDPAALKKHILSATIGGAVGGAIGGALLGGAATVVLSAGITILSAGFLSVAPTLVLPVFCAGAGAFLVGGAMRAEAKDYAAQGHTVDGVILAEPRNGADHLIFHRGGQVADGVDLNSYATAASPAPWWQSPQEGAQS